MTVPPLDEFGRIRAWTEGRQNADFLQLAGVVEGIGDDAAVLSVRSGQEWLVAVDTMVEQVHFLNETMRESDVGYKALAANVSDIAAMGGVPKFALVSASVPPSWNADRMKRLYDGLYECAKLYDVAVVGGDTTSAPQDLVVSVTLIGTVEQGRAILRSGAKPGQSVFVTGPTGLSAAGLHGLMRRSPLTGAATAESRIAPIPARLVQAHRRPAPSVRAGRLLLEKGWATSLNDISDGLASEAWELAEASGVKLLLKEKLLPMSGELASYARSEGLRPLELALFGGEDYVLIGTVDKEHEAAMRETFREEGLPLFVIGEVEQGKPAVELELADTGKRRPVEKKGYNHFVEGTM
jgi:thiamine-monophosphate kinase